MQEMPTSARPASRLRAWAQLIRQSLVGTEQDYTTGSIDRALVLLSIPMILEMAMESLFAVVDAFFVARVGIEAVATVGLTESVLTLVYSVAIGLSSAATAMVSRRIGEGNREAGAEAGAQTILLALALSALIALPGFFFAKDILRILANNAAVAESGYRFSQLLFTANLIVHKDMPDATAYAITKAVIENRDAIVSENKAMEGFVAKDAWRPENVGIPLHPGAVRYYRERGWM